jgi:hypothetical protein
VDLSRRSALALLPTIAGGVVLGLSSCRTSPSKSATLPDNALITFGVQAGPPPVHNKTGISSALKVGDNVYQ